MLSLFNTDIQTIPLLSQKSGLCSEAHPGWIWWQGLVTMHLNLIRFAANLSQISPFILPDV